MVGIVPVDRGDAGAIRQLRIDIVGEDLETRCATGQADELIELLAKCALRGFLAAVPVQERHHLVLARQGILQPIAVGEHAPHIGLEAQHLHD